MFLMKTGEKMKPVPLVLGDVADLQKIDADVGGYDAPSKDVLATMTWDELRFMWSRFGIKLSNLKGKVKTNVVDYLHAEWEQTIVSALRVPNERNLMKIPEKTKAFFYKLPSGEVLWVPVGSGQVVSFEHLIGHRWMPLIPDALKPLSIDQMQELCFVLIGQRCWDALRMPYKMPTKVTKAQMIDITIRCWADHHAGLNRAATEHESSESGASDDDGVVLTLKDYDNKFINLDWKDGSKGFVSIKVPTMDGFQCFFYYKDNTEVKNLKAYLLEKFDISDDTYTFYVDGSYLENHDTLDTYLEGTSKVLEMRLKLKGGGKKVIKTTLKCKPNVKTTDADRSLFEASFNMAKKVGGLSSDSVNFKEELKLMKIPELEDIKTYLVKDRTKKQLKLEKLVTYLGAHREMTLAQEKLTSALTSMKELFTENLETICANEEGDIDCGCELVRSRF